MDIIIVPSPGQEKLFYTDFVTKQILMAHLNGTESTPIMEDDLEVPGKVLLYGHIA